MSNQKTAKSQRTKQQGVIRQWNDDKGFGFIDMSNGESIFFHVSEFRAPRRPIEGENVVFDIGQGKNNKPQAKQVQTEIFVQQKQAEYQKRQEKREQYEAHQQDFESGQKRNLIIATLSYIALAIGAWQELLPWLAVAWYAVLGTVTFAMYAHDKRSAKNGGWRTPEKNLHILALLGGWIGAMLAQTYLRHKSQKQEFRLVYYITVLLNLVILVGLITQIPKLL